MSVPLSLLRALPVLLLLAGEAAAHGHHRHLLAGRSTENKPKRNKNRSDGKKFDFAAEEGGAAGYLSRMNSTKLKKALDNARWNKGEEQLAKLLDEDPDFVSCRLIWASRRGRRVLNLTRTSPCCSIC
jgi:hypothetical protein